MNFGDALANLKAGYLVRRAGWNGKNMFLYLVKGGGFTVSRPPLDDILGAGAVARYNDHVDMRTADGSLVPWLCTQSDMLAEDWEIAPKP